MKSPQLAKYGNKYYDEIVASKGGWGGSLGEMGVGAREHEIS